MGALVDASVVHRFADVRRRRHLVGGDWRHAPVGQSVRARGWVSLLHIFAADTEARVDGETAESRTGIISEQYYSHVLENTRIDFG